MTCCDNSTMDQVLTCLDPPTLITNASCVGLADGDMACNSSSQNDRSKTEKPAPHDELLAQPLSFLQVLIQEVEEKVLTVESIDELEAINDYCDSLEIQVMETVDSAVRQLNRLQDELLKKINDHRKELTELRTKADTTCRGAKNKNRQDLDALSQQLNKLRSDLSELFNRPNKSAVDDEIERAHSQIRELSLGVSLAKNRVKRELSNGRVLQLEENSLFYLVDNLEGLFDTSSSFQQGSFPFKHWNMFIVFTSS